MTHEGEHLSEPSEAQKHQYEQILDRHPGTKGILASVATGASRHEFSDPVRKYSHRIKQQIKDDLPNKSPADIDCTEVNQKSRQSRIDYWAGNEDYALWRGGICGWIQQRENDGDVKEVLRSVGFYPEGKVRSLDEQIDTFHTTYFENKSTVDDFIRDIAQTCNKENDAQKPTDMTLLRKRLEAAKDLLVCFGIEVDGERIDDLVANYALSYGLLNQESKDKTIIAAMVAESLQEERLPHKSFQPHSLEESPNRRQLPSLPKSPLLLIAKRKALPQIYKVLFKMLSLMRQGHLLTIFHLSILKRY